MAWAQAPRPKKSTHRELRNRYIIHYSTPAKKR
jgi:hypothetical protein